MAGRPKGGEKRGGRVKGTPNKVTAELRDMILGALSDVGGQTYLATQALENPGAFMTLVGKCLPKDMTLTGKDGGPIEVSRIEIVPFGYGDASD